MGANVWGEVHLSCIRHDPAGESERLGLIANLKIEDDDFMSLVVEDSFFSRMTGMTELIL